MRVSSLLTLLIAGSSIIAMAARAQGPAADQPMAADAHPSFAVATIKPSDPSSTRGWAFPSDGRHIACTNATVPTIMALAYGIHAKQIVGAPEWLDKARYDINGIPDVAGVPSLNQMQEMYRKLLTDRFHLTFHHEVRDLPVYAITIAKGGAKLKPADPGETLNTGNSGSGGQRTLKFTNMSLADFALNMNLYEDRPVVDQTSLTSRYDFSLTWTYDITKEGAPNAPPGLFTAIQDQLGLKLVPTRALVDVFVIDHVAQPTAN